MAKNITFDKAQYDKLIADLVALEDSLKHDATKHGMPIDEEFNPVPGTAAWVLADLQTKGKALGASVKKLDGTIADQLDNFITALKNARSIFDETNDLAQFSITDFLSEYPDLGSGGKA